MAKRLEFTGERVVPDRTPIYLIWAHTARYQFIREGVRGKTVLDAGCGEGYGSHYLAQYAKQVVGVDVSHEAIVHAQATYARPNLHYAEMDCSSLGFADSAFDVICSFEVIEHLHQIDRFVGGIRKILKPDGLFYVSTPNAEVNSLQGRNPYHEKEFTLCEYEETLRAHCPIVDVYGQFCLRPFREWLYVESTRLFFRSTVYRGLLERLAPLYFSDEAAHVSAQDPDWVERSTAGTFAFTRTSVERASYFLAVCRKEA